MKDTINIGDTKEMLCEMLAIPSVSGDAGAECVRQQIVDGDRRNVFAEVTGSLPGKTILLTGHMDTVEAGDGWTVNPFAGTERDGRIYGRGANDMKAGIAIILQTVSTCVRNRGRLRGKIVVAFVCDEEAYSEGVLCAIKEGNIHADFGIAAEPEYHHAVIGSCGKVLIRAVAHGKAAHAAEAESPISLCGLGVVAIATAWLFQIPVKRLSANILFQEKRRKRSLWICRVLCSGKNCMHHSNLRWRNRFTHRFC